MDDFSSQNDPARTAAVFQIKITLDGIKPAIWRRIRVRETMTLHTLHIAIQSAMGWEDKHLYEFTIKGARYTPIETGDGAGSDAANTESLPLTGLRLKKGDTFSYVYDFGDYWSHEILIEDLPAPDAESFYPVCTAGARACPPEDCGGLPGFEELIEALKDSKHPEHEETKTKLRGTFDPSLFKIKEANEELRSAFPS